MSDELSHLAQAVHNQDTINHLLNAPSDQSDWIATAAFYKALHLVEAVFANDKKISHGHNHETRERILKVYREYSDIGKHYRILWSISMVSRYLQGKDSKSYHAFSEYMTADEVKSKVLGHLLHQVQKGAIKHLSDAGKKAVEGLI